MSRELQFPAGAFDRIDERDDADFYSFPRRVVHIDDGAIAALGLVYADLVPVGGRVLDVMASWRSHLPSSFAGHVVGLGMNADEMRDNPQLDDSIVHDLNRHPTLPFPEAAFDAALCAVSVQYLTRPVEVFREIRRVLKPVSPFVLAFSNRCFHEKAVALWRATSDAHHVALVQLYFDAAGGFDAPTTRAFVPEQGDPLFAVWATRTAA